MNKYRLVSKKGEGTFSEVLKASSIVTGEYFAIKCMKSQFKSLEQVNALREIQALKRLGSNENILKLFEVLFDAQSGRLALVFELLELNLYEKIRNRKTPLAADLVCNLMFQLVKAIHHIHQNGIFHRDIKPENILLSSSSAPYPRLVVADFGSCRGLHTPPPHTEYISTRWYRAPECLLTNGNYDYKMDCFGVGCVMFEIIALFPLFPGTNELDQIERIHSILGTPSPELLSRFKNPSSHMKNINFHPRQGSGVGRLIPHASPEAIDLICKLIAYDPEKRISAKQALKHPYFKECRDRERKEKLNSQNSPAPPLSSPQTVETPRLPNIQNGNSQEFESTNNQQIKKKEKEKEKEREREKEKEREKDHREKDKEKDKDKDKERSKDRRKHRTSNQIIENNSLINLANSTSNGNSIAAALNSNSNSISHSASKSSISNQKSRHSQPLQMFPALKISQSSVAPTNSSIGGDSSVGSQSRFPALESLAISGQKSKHRKNEGNAVAVQRNPANMNFTTNFNLNLPSHSNSNSNSMVDVTVGSLSGRTERKSKKHTGILGSQTARK